MPNMKLSMYTGLGSGGIICKVAINVKLILSGAAFSQTFTVELQGPGIVFGKGVTPTWALMWQVDIVGVRVTVDKINYIQSSMKVCFVRTKVIHNSHSQDDFPLTFSNSGLLQAQDVKSWLESGQVPGQHQ